MPEHDRDTSASPHGSLPWWIHLCRWVWKIAALLGIAIVFPLAINITSTSLTNSKGAFPPDSPVGWLVARWPVMLPIGGCFLLLALLTRMASQWNAAATPIPLPTAQERERMLRRLRFRYEQMLASSLQRAVVQIELGLASRPIAVHNAASLALRLPDQPDQPLPAHTSIVQAYELAQQDLLILGEPGAGKSTLLLELAHHLVEQAEQDAAQPLPVLLPLPSWATKKPPLLDWLIEQFAQLYNLSQKLSEQWIAAEQLLPLLDGLDEMEASARADCIAAINTYHRNHLQPLVVCSRTNEYETAVRQEKLSLHTAVVVQPLLPAQIDTYLETLGKPLAGLRAALRKKPVLQGLATTPLMLQVLMLTYYGTSVRELSRKAPQLQEQIWTDYVKRMLNRKRDTKRYPLDVTITWLSWLAQQMRKHNQTIFYLEYLQPNWLPASQQRIYTWFAVQLPGILIGVLATLIVFLFFGAWDAVTLLQYCILGGFLGGQLSAIATSRMSFQHMQNSGDRRSGRLALSRLVTSALVALSFVLSFGKYLGSTYTAVNWFSDICIFGVSLGLSCFLLTYLLPSSVSRQSQVTSKRPTRGWKLLLCLIQTLHGRCALLVAAVFGAGIGLSNGLSNGLNHGLNNGLSNGVSNGLRLGLVSVLVSLVLEAQTRNIQLVERLTWSWKRLLRSLLMTTHIRTTILFASIIALMNGLSFGLSNGLSKGLGEGLGFGLGIGLGYWLLFGLFQSIASERIEDQDRRVPNQGIRRSSRNSLLIGMLSAPLPGLISILTDGLRFTLGDGLIYGIQYGLYFEPNYGLGKGLNYGLNIGWFVTCSISSGLFVYTITGGQAVLRHYILRLLLWRTHLFPLQTVSFLEDTTACILLRKVGGGYSFTHRLLLDYFADLDPHAPLSPSAPTTAAGTPP